MPDFFCIHDYILHFGPTQWIRIINKSLEVYENEVEIDTFEQNLQKMDIFCDKCFKNNPVSQKSSPSLVLLQKSPLEVGGRKLGRECHCALFT